jgi:hypothetical protein
MTMEVGKCEESKIVEIVNKLLQRAKAREAPHITACQRNNGSGQHISLKLFLPFGNDHPARHSPARTQNQRHRYT